MSEKWAEFHPNYAVSDQGNVRNIATGTVLRPYRDGHKGYVAVSIGKTQRKIHRLVAGAFLGGGEGLQVNHKNGVKDDNRLDNLEWVTGAANMRHSFDVLGRRSSGGHAGKTGESHHASKRVRAISVATGDVLEFGSAEQARLALGIPSGSIPRCCAGKWRHSHGWKFEYIKLGGESHGK